MKPIRIIMRAFGPYADEQIIDFRDLGDFNFFLIHGPTGSGKTTLLDAICFALYGETSGDIRTARQMRSDYASPKVPTEVILDFRIGPESYRVQRMPEQELPGKRSDELKVVKTQATLWQRTLFADNAEHDSPDGTVLADKPKLVTQEIQKLLGFESKQFRQVVMLPQGQFQQFLMSKSVERQNILEVLFQTAFYRQIEEQLKSQTRSIADDLSKARLQQEHLLGQAEVDTPDALAVKLQALQAERQQWQQSREALTEREKYASEKLNQGLALYHRFQALDNANIKGETLQQQASEIEAQRHCLALAEQALQIQPYEQACQEKQQALTEQSTRQKNIQSQYDQALATLKAAQQEVTVLQAVQGEYDALQREIQQLEILSPKLEQRNLLQHELQRRFQEAEKLKNQLEQAEQASKALEHAISEAETDLTALEKSLQKRDSLTQDLKNARQNRLWLQQVQEKQQLLDTKALESLASQREQAERELLSLKKQLIEAEGALWQNYAARLAEQLADNAPCPVCGACEHPHPASAGTDVDGAAIARHRDEVEVSQRRLSGLCEAEAEIKSQHNALEAEIKLLRGLLTFPESTPEVLDGKIQMLDEAFQMLKSDQALQSKLEQELKTDKDTLNDAQKNLASCFQDHQSLQTEITRLQATLDALQSDIPTDWHDLTDTQTSLKDKQTRLATHQQAVKTTQTALQESEKTRIRLQANLEDAQFTLNKFKEDLTSAKYRLSEKLLDAGFSQNSDYEAARAFIEKRNTLKASLSQYEQAQHTVQETRALLQDELSGKVPPDLDALQTTRDEAQERLLDAQSRLSSTQEKLTQCEKHKADLQEIQTRQEKLDAEYGTLGLLADVARGKNEPGISLNRFVLSTMLDQVLEAASERLKLMSRGRFVLHRALERTNKATSGGLDLEISDAMTGTMRPVNTLSGGESFLASLSLALGMADVVQSFSGGVRLETIFIDEGFGSLDAESLDLALRALIDLQQEGRLVGIISHVPELKERIDARLEVRPTRHGSTAKFITTHQPQGHTRRVPSPK